MSVTVEQLHDALDGITGVAGRAENATVAAVGLVLEAVLDAILTKLPAGPATQTTLAAVLAKLPADPSTAAKQDTQAGKLDILHNDLAATLAAKIDTLVAKDYATQTTLAAVKAKTDNLDVALSTRTKP